MAAPSADRLRCLRCRGAGGRRRRGHRIDQHVAHRQFRAHHPFACEYAAAESAGAGDHRCADADAVQGDRHAHAAAKPDRPAVGERPTTARDDAGSGASSDTDARDADQSGRAADDDQLRQGSIRTGADPDSGPVESQSTAVKSVLSAAVRVAVLRASWHLFMPFIWAFFQFNRLADG